MGGAGCSPPFHSTAPHQPSPDPLGDQGGQSWGEEWRRSRQPGWGARGDGKQRRGSLGRERREEACGLLEATVTSPPVPRAPWGPGFSVDGEADTGVHWGPGASPAPQPGIKDFAFVFFFPHQDFAFEMDPRGRALGAQLGPGS